MGGGRQGGVGKKPDEGVVSGKPQPPLTPAGMLWNAHGILVFTSACTKVIRPWQGCARRTAQLGTSGSVCRSPKSLKYQPLKKKQKNSWKLVRGCMLQTRYFPKVAAAIFPIP